MNKLKYYFYLSTILSYYGCQQCCCKFPFLSRYNMKVLELKGTKTDNYFFKYTENVW